MKYTAVAALLGAASANQQTEKVFVQDEMQSLLKIIRSVETTDASAVLDVIETRKEQLQLLMDSHPERASHVVGELHNLLAVTKTLEDKDMNGALNELEVRKDELTQKAQDIIMMGGEAADKDAEDAMNGGLPNVDAPAEEEKEAAKELTPEEQKAAAKKLEDAKADEKAKAKALEDAKAANEKAPTDDTKKAVKDAQTAEDAAVKKVADLTPKDEGGSSTPIIVGVVAALAAVGLGVFCYMKNNKSEDQEGGDRMMFKAVIKNKSTQKQNLV